ncbi:hypothetical protein ACVR1G_09585 [Streptococcus dentasini]
MAALTDKEKVRIDGLRKENGIKNMYYTRYFLIRYAVVFFFFVNLYWLLLLLLSGKSIMSFLPILLGGMGAACMWEQYQMYTREQKTARITQSYFYLIIAVNGALILLTLLNQYRYFYPFLSNSTAAKLFIIIILALGMLISAWMLRKLNQINQKKDRQYHRIQQYLASLK